jgi:hypothetical protein
MPHMTRIAPARAIPFANPASPLFVSAVVSPVTRRSPALPPTPVARRGPSIQNGRLTSLSIEVEGQSASPSTCVAPAPMGTLHMDSIPAPCAVTTVIQPGFAPAISYLEILYKFVSPYQPFAWWLALYNANIHTHFLNLVHDLTYGSPIGNPPPLRHTFIPPNLSSAKLNPSYVLQSLLDEVASGRMDGPFSVPDAHHVFGGHFRTSPLGLVEKAGSSTEFRLIQHLSKLDASGESTNGWLDAKDFPTCYFSAVQCADLVSLPFPLFCPGTCHRRDCVSMRCSALGGMCAPMLEVGCHAPLIQRPAVKHLTLRGRLSCTSRGVGCYAPSLASV